MRFAPVRSALSQAITAVALTAAVSTAPGCGKHPGSYESLSAEGNGDVEALITEAEALWAERHDAAKLEQALVKYEEAVRIDPEHRDALIHLTRGWYLLGDAHASEKETKIAHWDKALEWGAICLAANSAFAEAIAAGEKERRRITAAARSSTSLPETSQHEGRDGDPSVDESVMGA